jgi:hypothetical protein
MNDPVTFYQLVLVMAVFTGLLGVVAAMAAPELFGDDD